jgi:hypothetical protein
LIITFNFPSPELDYAILPLITTAFFTQVPLWIALLIITIRKAIKTSNSKKTIHHDTTDDNKIEENEKLNSKNSLN